VKHGEETAAAGITDIGGAISRSAGTSQIAIADRSGSGIGVFASRSYSVFFVDGIRRRSLDRARLASLAKIGGVARLLERLVDSLPTVVAGRVGVDLCRL